MEYLSNPAVPTQQPPPQSLTPTPQPEVKEMASGNELVRPYERDAIEKDAKKWLPSLLPNKNLNLKPLIPRPGISRTEGRKTVASYGVTIPVDEVPALQVDQIKHALSDASHQASSVSDIDTIYSLDKFDVRGGNYVLIVRKTTNY